MVFTITHFTLHCYRIDAWAIRRPWLTFVNALANSILEHFYTARIQRFASCAWPMVLQKLGNKWKWKGESWFHYTKVLFCRCCWNDWDVILFSVVWKITASRENRGELLGDEVMKTASHRNCSLQVTLMEFEQLLQSTEQEMGVSKWQFQSQSLTSLFSAVQYNRVSNMRIQHFVSSNLW